MRPTNNCQRYHQQWFDHNPTASTGPHLSLNTAQALACQNDQCSHQQPLQQSLQQPPSFSFTQSASDASFTALVSPAGVNGQHPVFYSNGHSPPSLYPVTPIAMSPSPQFETASEAHSPARSNASHEAEGRRTGRPAYWRPDRCRQVIREYVYSTSSLSRVIQLFHKVEDNNDISVQEAQGKVAAIQKKIHVLIGKDARPLRPRDEAYAQKRRQFRHNPKSHTQRHDQRSNESLPPTSPQRQPTELIKTLERTLSSISNASMQNFMIIRNFTVKSWNTLMSANPPVLPRLPPRFTTPQPSLRLSELVTTPGDLLNIDTLTGESHGSYDEGITFQAIASELDTTENLWVTRQTLTDRGYQLFQALHHNYISVDIGQIDYFGNTVLHFLAARPDCQGRLLSLLESQQPSLKLLAGKNTAGQTFLHVLSAEWFANPTDCLFIKLLNLIPYHVPKLVQARDVYGRTVLHRIVECIPERGNALDLVNAVIFSYDCKNPPILHRSAFGGEAYRAEAPNGYTPEDLLSQPFVMEPCQLKPRVYNPFVDANGVYLEPRDRYMRIIEDAIQDPFIEDGKGRGPLHCLAELAPDLLPFDKSGDKSPNGKLAKSPISNITDGFAQMARTKKRKADDAEASPDSDALLNEPSCLSLLKRLLDEAGCSPSAYDCAGNTALMMFISTVEDRSQLGLQAALKMLIKAAQAEGLLDARNRAGETALVLAARLGKKTAVRLLVEAGANWHVRDHHGWGLIRIINREISRFKHDTAMYPGIEISWAMLARKDGVEFMGMDEEAVLYPDVYDEWGVEGRVSLGTVGGDLQEA